MARFARILFALGIIAFVITTLIGDKELKIKTGIVFASIVLICLVAVTLY